MFATEYYIWLSRALGAGSEKAKKLFEYFGNIRKIYEAEKFDYLKAGISENTVKMRALCSKELDEAKRIAEYCRENNVYMLTCDDPLFPKSLKAIPSSPVILYCKGRMIDFNDCVCIGMVGSRSCTVSGLATAYGIAYKCAQHGVVVASGLAEGIDSACMRGALDAGGLTCGFIASGIDIVYPKSNAHLYERTAQSGVILTEYAPGTRPIAANFICRNRLIAALSQGSVMFEGTMKSGAMSTMKYAEKFGKTLYAVPGSITANVSEGTNHLIKNGAKIITESKDILNDFIYLYPHALTPPVASDFPQKVAIPSDLLDESKLRVNKQAQKTQNNLKQTSSEKSATAKKPRQISVFSSASGKNPFEPDTAQEDIPEISEEPITIDFSDNDAENSKTELTTPCDNAKKAKDFSPLPDSIAEVVGEDGVAIHKLICNGKGKNCDEIALALGLEIDKVLTAVSLLEAFGAVVQKPGGIIELV